MRDAEAENPYPSGVIMHSSLSSVVALLLLAARFVVDTENDGRAARGAFIMVVVE